MKDITEVRASWQKVYESVKIFIDEMEQSYKQREERIDRGLAEIKLINEKIKLLDNEKAQLALDKEIVEKQFIIELISKLQFNLEGIEQAQFAKQIVEKLKIKETPKA